MNSFELLANWLYQLSIIDKKEASGGEYKWKVMFALDLIQRIWVMWEPYRMEQPMRKEDGDTKNQDNNPQQNYAQDGVAFGPENDK